MGTKHGDFYWNELFSGDAEKSRKFYTDLLGWQFTGMEMPEGGTYWVAMVGDQPKAGIVDKSTVPGLADTPDCWFSYIAVTDVDKSAARLQETGGTLHRPVFDIPKVGRIAIIGDTTGASLGLIQPAECNE